MHVFVAAVLLLQASSGQQPRPNPAGWPCGARLDPSYFQIAEGTGGHLFLLAPDEVGQAAPLLTAAGSHRQTIFRHAGTLEPGTHEMKVPIDPSVESAVFSVSSQCLQAPQLLRPSGELVSGDGVTDLSNFRAARMVIVQRPEAGLWTIRFVGHGMSGVVVQARTGIGIARVHFAAHGRGALTLPAAGVENTMTVELDGQIAGARATLVSADFRPIADLVLEGTDAPGRYVARFTPGAQGFRLLITGTRDDGAPVQRLHAPLLTAVR